ncbi:PIG-L family deacetylase [Streptomyces sp. NPDC056144]|uniref:PIG-L family deacetylase n=1 Tax=unclassified Streptomyces TaxID=2593676 RepID=UPI0035D5FB83
MPVSRRTSPPSRRRVLTTVGTAVLVAGTFAGLLSVTANPAERATSPSTPTPSVTPTTAGTPTPSGTPAPAASPARAAHQRASVLQVVAHPDDDLFFMNPDVSQSLRSGSPLTAVYLTSGESDGVNAARRGAVEPDKAGYAEARQNGIRAAYAEMATGDRTSPWDRTTIPTAGGASAELDTLRAEPHVSLVWVQLKEAGSTNGDSPHSLNGLWHGRVPALASQRAAGTPVAEDFTYTKDQVVDVITGLLERFRPTFVRMQDPSPGTYPETGKLRDHQDHLYGARFTQAALDRYARIPGHPHVGVQNYLGYPTTTLPHTLDPETSGEKLKTVKTYSWLDRVNDCGTEAGCGDLKVAVRPTGAGWTSTVRYARGTSTSWVQRDRTGALHAFSVLDGRLATWRKPAGESAWHGPELLAGGGLDSGITSVLRPDGRIAVFGTRTTLGDDPADYRREVVTAEQTTAGPEGSFGPWRSLGTPERNDAAGTSDISAPAVTVGRDGRATLVLRDSAHRLTAREQGADGAWGPWRTLGGADLYGDPVAATDASGRGHVFAGTPKTVLVWAAERPGGPLVGPTPTGLPPTTLALSASPVTGADEGAAGGGDAGAAGGVRLWFRKPSSGDLRSAAFSGTGLVSPYRELTGGVAGFGPVSGATGGEGMLAVRSRTGFLATAPMGRGGTRPQWTLEGFLFSGAPDAGREGVAAIGLDGRLHWTPANR